MAQFVGIDVDGSQASAARFVRHYAIGYARGGRQGRSSGTSQLVDLGGERNGRERPDVAADLPTRGREEHGRG